MTTVSDQTEFPVKLKPAVLTPEFLKECLDHEIRRALAMLAQHYEKQRKERQAAEDEKRKAEEYHAKSWRMMFKRFTRSAIDRVLCRKSAEPPALIPMPINSSAPDDLGHSQSIALTPQSRRQRNFYYTQAEFYRIFPNERPEVLIQKAIRGLKKEEMERASYRA